MKFRKLPYSKPLIQKKGKTLDGRLLVLLSPRASDFTASGLEIFLQH